jgi:hypothetical protein
MRVGQQFRLTPELITLLRKSNVSGYLSDCEYGAAEIDGKRPYGNSNVARDIAEILGWDWDEDGDNDEAYDRARALHKQTPQALQVVLASGSFESGVYVADNYRSNWRKECDL